MPKIYPFRGYRYDTQRVGDLSRVVTQPYDKIGPALQQEYLQRSPYNLAWVIKSPEKKSDPETNYPEAGRRFHHWLQEGILKQDARPAIYPYIQQFTLEGQVRRRSAFVALLDLRGGSTQVRAHERTMAEPKQDRLRLIRATESNDGLIFMLYRDPADRANSALRQLTDSEPPAVRVTDDFGVDHQLWTVSDENFIRRVQEATSELELFIADGHHRFETALNFMNECDARGWKPAAVESFDKRMAALINAEDPGLLILPTHRLVQNVESFDPATFLQRTGEFFTRQSFEDLTTLQQHMAGGPPTRLGFHASGYPGFHLLTLTRPSELRGLLPSASEDCVNLDVNVLHALILDHLLGIDEMKLVAGTHVSYERDAAGAVKKTARGEFQAVFLMNPTTTEQVLRVAGRGERMPQKSTDFFPKLLSGLVIMKMMILKD